MNCASAVLEGPPDDHCVSQSHKPQAIGYTAAVWCSMPLCKTPVRHARINVAMPDLVMLKLKRIINACLATILQRVQKPADPFLSLSPHWLRVFQTFNCRQRSQMRRNTGRRGYEGAHARPRCRVPAWISSKPRRSAWSARYAGTSRHARAAATSRTSASRNLCPRRCPAAPPCSPPR